MIEFPPFWTMPPDELTLKAPAVHLWLARLDVSGDQRRYLSETLSPDERQRAERFSFDQHRAHYIAGRGLLRSLLGRYLQVNPAQLRFAYNAFEKPTLDPSSAPETLSFNLSHSNGLALFAFTRGSEIGVDIEYIRERTDLEQTGAIVFSSPESAAFQALPPGQRRSTFFQFWTRKEAFIKALGQGFALPLHQFDVSGTPGKPVANLDAATGLSRFTNWFIRDIRLPQGYTGAIAREGNGWPVSFFSLPDPYLF